MPCYIHEGCVLMGDFLTVCIHNQVGNVLASGGGAAMARIAQMLAGIPHSVPLSTVNRQCSSGLQAFASVAAAITAGQYEIGLACGVESMSMDDMGNVKPILNWDAVAASPVARECLIPMGVTSENVADQFGVSRQYQDAFAAESHKRAARAQANGWFDNEIVPVPVPSKEGTATTIVDKDDGIRPGATVASLSKLKPVFKAGGSTTAGNASQMTDGAAAVLVMKRSTARKLHLPVLAILKAFSVVGVPPAIMGVGPAFAIPAALSEAELSVDDVDVFEINEAFASQAVYCAQQLKVVPGGACFNYGVAAVLQFLERATLFAARAHLSFNPALFPPPPSPSSRSLQRS